MSKIYENFFGDLFVCPRITFLFITKHKSFGLLFSSSENTVYVGIKTNFTEFCVSFFWSLMHIFIFPHFHIFIFSLICCRECIFLHFHYCSTELFRLDNHRPIDQFNSSKIIESFILQFNMAMRS